MANEYRLSFTASEIDEKLRKVDSLSSGGVSSWNDLTDKPFGENEDGTVTQLNNKYLAILDRTEASETDIIAEQDIEFVYDSGASMGYVVPVSAASVVEGNVYIVIFDEVKYGCIAFTHPDGASGTFIGNATYVAAGSDTGEPFIATISSGEANETGENMLAMMTLDTADTTHKVRIYQETPEKYTLKEEYLPDTEQPTSIDLSGFDTNGTIVETYAGGISKTTTIEFDDNNNPIKITDSDGKVTTLAW